MDFGVEVRSVVLGPAEAGPTVRAVASPEVPLILRLWSLARSSVQWLDHADVLDVHFAAYGMLSVLRARRRGMPVIVHFHGPWADEGKSLGQSSVTVRVKRLLERWVYRRANAVVTETSAFRQVFIERYGAVPWHVQVLPPSVDLRSFTPGARERARESLGLPAEARVVAAVRRLVPRMGLDVLLKAWAAVVGGHPERLLVIAGEGPARPELENRVAELGLGASVRFVGRVGEGQLVDLYRAADVCAVPSVALEGFGLVVLEALACGTPVVASDAGGLPEVLFGLDPGLCVPVGRADLLAARLAEGLDGQQPFPDPEACRRYASAYSKEAFARNHLELYSRARRRTRDTRLRVVYLDHCARLSGSEVALLRLLPALTGVNAHVVLGEEGPLVGSLLRAGVSVEIIPMASAARDLHREEVRPGQLPLSSAVGGTTYATRLAARLRRLRPDLVHTNSLKAGLYGALAARAAGVPIVWHARDRLTDDYLPLPAARLVRQVVHRLPAAVVSNSRATLSTLGVESAGQRRRVIPDPFERSRAGRGATQNDHLVVGIVGRLAPWKGQHLFLEAFARAFPTGPITAAIVGSALFGEDAYAAQLYELADVLGVRSRVDFRGFRERVDEEMDRLDVLVHASAIPEPFGQVVVEGMAAGLPVLAADAGGPAEILTDGIDGILYPMGDVNALAEALRCLAADSRLRQRLGAAAASRAADFQPAAIASAVEQLYWEVLAAR
jgi:glycosyltransferase involved in cell wall biosynthesis